MSLQDNKTRIGIIAFGGIGITLVLALLFAPSFAGQDTYIFTGGNSGSNGTSTDCINLADQYRVLSNQTGDTCYFRSLANGNGITLAVNSTHVSITNSKPESSACVNDGTGTSLCGTTVNIGLKSITGSSAIGFSCVGNSCTISNTGVTSLAANSPVTVSGSTGSVTISCSTCITSLTAGTGISITGGTTISNTYTCTSAGGTSIIKTSTTGSNCDTKGLAVTSPITLTSNTNDLTIACSTCLTTANGDKYIQLGQASTVTTGDTLNVLTQNSGTAAVTSCASTTADGCGEKITATSALLGKIVNSMTLGLSKGGSPTGTCTVGAMDSTNSVLYTFGTIDSSTLTTTPAAYTFTNSGASRTIASGDYLGINCPTQSAGNTVRASRSTTDVYDSTNSVFSVHTSGSWSDQTQDLGDSTAAEVWKLDTTFTLLDLSSLTAKSNVDFRLVVATTGGTMQLGIRFNGDSGTNYADRFSNNGAADTTNVSQTSCLINGANNFAKSDAMLINGYIKNNQSGERKMVFGEIVYGGDTNAGTAPSKVEFTCKWSNTANQVTQISFVQTASGGGLMSNPLLTVWGYN